MDASADLPHIERQGRLDQTDDDPNSDDPSQEAGSGSEIEANGTVPSDRSHSRAEEITEVVDDEISRRKRRNRTNRADLEELKQDAIMNLLESSNGDGDGDVSEAGAQKAVQKSLDKTKNEYRRGGLLRMHVPELVACSKELVQDPAELAMIHEEAERFYECFVAAISRLPSLHRRIFVARHFQGRKLKDIAAEVGRSIAHVSRKLVEICECLKEDLPEEVGRSIAHVSRNPGEICERLKKDFAEFDDSDDG